MFVPLAHLKGHAQADFGEAVVVIARHCPRNMYGWLLHGKVVVWLLHLVGCGHVYGVWDAAGLPRALMKVRVDLAPINGARS